MIINFAMHEKMLISRKITGADPELTCYDNVQELYLMTTERELYCMWVLHVISPGPADYTEYN